MDYLTMPISYCQVTQIVLVVGHSQCGCCLVMTAVNVLSALSRQDNSFNQRLEAFAHCDAMKVTMQIPVY